MNSFPFFFAGFVIDNANVASSSITCLSANKPLSMINDVASADAIIAFARIAGTLGSMNIVVIPYASPARNIIDVKYSSLVESTSICPFSNPLA